jgi:hypothetical protein
MHQGDEDDIRRKAYELWENEGRPEGRHDDHWRRAHETFKQDKTTAEISGGSAGVMTPDAGDGTPDVSAADQPGDLPADTPAEDVGTQDKAMIPENSAEHLTQTTPPEPGSEPTPPAKRPRNQRKKT